jgi:hypothetical protein
MSPRVLSGRIATYRPYMPPASAASEDPFPPLLSRGVVVVVMCPSRKDQACLGRGRLLNPLVPSPGKVLMIRRFFWEQNKL